MYNSKPVNSNQDNIKSVFQIGKENWLLIFLFILLLLITSTEWPNSSQTWLPYVICALVIYGINFLYFAFNYGVFSKFSRNFLLYRIFWSLTLSLYIIMSLIHIFYNLESGILEFFYSLALVDIFLNIFNKSLTNEIGPGFLPKLI